MIHDSLLGNYQEIITAKATDSKITKKSQDGGLISALFIYALQENIIDGAIVAGQSKEPWNPEPIVATTKKDILKGSGTKYTMCPNISLIKEATREYGLEKIGTVGTPCQIMGIRKFQTYPLGARFVADKIALSLGIFCMENFPYESIKTFITEKGKTTPANVTKLNITKGKLFITTAKGDIKIPLKETQGYEQSGCSICMDYVAELADLSCGSVGSKPGWSTVIKRTNKGISLLDKAIEEGVIETAPIDEGKFGLEMLNKLSKNKKEKHQKIIDQKIELGLNIPFKHSKDKKDPLENI